MFTPVYKPYIEKNRESTYEEIVRRQFPSATAAKIIGRHRKAKRGIPYDYIEGVSPEFFKV